MRKTAAGLLAMALIGTSQVAVAAEWKLAFWGRDLAVLVDASSIRVEGALKRVKALSVFTDVQETEGMEYDNSTEGYLVDCRARKVKAISNPAIRLGGKIVAEKQGEYEVPEGYERQLVPAVCDGVYLRDGALESVNIENLRRAMREYRSTRGR